jgi:hypothetical protein
MAAPTNAANIKKALANFQPSANGSSRALNAYRILRYCFDFSGPGLVPSGGAISTTRLSAARPWIVERVMTRSVATTIRVLRRPPRHPPKTSRKKQIN